jgi:hypothetical protein
MTTLAVLIVAGPLAGPVATALRARARAAGMASVAGALVALSAAVGLVAAQLHRAPLRLGRVLVRGFAEWLLSPDCRRSNRAPRLAGDR